jgi:hypothetical protein
MAGAHACSSCVEVLKQLPAIRLSAALGGRGGAGGGKGKRVGGGLHELAVGGEEEMVLRMEQTNASKGTSRAYVVCFRLLSF